MFFLLFVHKEELDLPAERHVMKANIQNSKFIIHNFPMFCHFPKKSFRLYFSLMEYLIFT